MSVYGIKVEGFEDPSFGFEDPSFGFEDPSFGYKDGELSASLSNFMGRKGAAKLKRDGDVLHIAVAKLDRPVRLVPVDKEKAKGYYNFFGKGMDCVITVQKPSPDLVAPRRDVLALITLSPK